MSVKIDGTRIRALRLDRSWSQELLAEQAGVSLRTIQRMETEGVASLQSRRAIAAAFGVSASEFTPAGAAGEPAGAATAPARAAVGLSLRTKALTIASWALLMAALVGGAFLWPHRDDNEPPALDEATAAGPRIVSVAYGDIENSVAVSGTLRPAEVVDVAARTAGVVTEILVEVGDTAATGEILALLDTEEQVLRVESARLRLEQLQNWIVERELNLRNAESELLRLDERLSAGLAVSREMDQARRALLEAHTSLDNLKLDIERGATELAREEMLLRHSEIRAPITGTVMSIEARAGAALGTGATAAVVLRMADLSRMAVEARITEADVARFRARTECYFTTLGSSQRRAANLTRIDPIGLSGRDGIGFVARLEVTAPGSDLFPGMTALVNCIGARAENVLTVPVSALIFPDAPDNTSRAFVRLVRADGTIEDRELVIGAADRANVEVVSGLAAGDRVVTGTL